MKRLILLCVLCCGGCRTPKFCETQIQSDIPTEFDGQQAPIRVQVHYRVVW